MLKEVEMAESLNFKRAIIIRLNVANKNRERLKAGISRRLNGTRRVVEINLMKINSSLAPW